MRLYRKARTQAIHHKSGTRYLLTSRHWFVGETKISRQAATILLALMGRPRCSIDFLADILWPDPDLMPDNFFNVIAVTIRALRRAGVAIETINRSHGAGQVGYSLATGFTAEGESCLSSPTATEPGDRDHDRGPQHDDATLQDDPAGQLRRAPGAAPALLF